MFKGNEAIGKWRIMGDYFWKTKCISKNKAAYSQDIYRNFGSPDTANEY